MKTVSLALRNLTRNKRRNAILAIAIAFGFFVVTAIDGLTTGMVGNLENQITQQGSVIWKKYEVFTPAMNLFLERLKKYNQIYKRPVFPG